MPDGPAPVTAVVRAIKTVLAEYATRAPPHEICHVVFYINLCCLHESFFLSPAIAFRVLGGIDIRVSDAADVWLPARLAMLLAAAFVGPMTDIPDMFETTLLVEAVARVCGTPPSLVWPQYRTAQLRANAWPMARLTYDELGVTRTQCAAFDPVFLRLLRILFPCIESVRVCIARETTDRYVVMHVLRDASPEFHTAIRDCLPLDMPHLSRYLYVVVPSESGPSWHDDFDTPPPLEILPPAPVDRPWYSLYQHPAWPVRPLTAKHLVHPASTQSLLSGFIQNAAAIIPCVYRVQTARSIVTNCTYAVVLYHPGLAPSIHRDIWAWLPSRLRDTDQILFSPYECSIECVAPGTALSVLAPHRSFR
jgi:hypothetical protein